MYKLLGLLLLFISFYSNAEEVPKYLSIDEKDYNYSFVCHKYTVTSREGEIYKFMIKDGVTKLKHVPFNKVLAYMSIYCAEPYRVFELVGILER